MPLVSNMGRRFVDERLASIVRGPARMARRQEASSGHPFGAGLYCRREAFGAEHYCRHEPFGGNLYLNIDSDLL